ncbi:MAG: imidazole glycerol phosphate synthase subunit HisH [Actinobacteria bacterium]|nr:imidazole glycerol phosphate synthase subunit HisH [Actinomycetota bacterium]NBP53186.1 imidazole glycerol phosphate synthase subunit HisH [Actinomycetota bacterium]
MTAPLVAVLDYGIGNLSSAQKALVRTGADARLTRDPGLVADADGVVLPGVGAFGACMDALRESGLEPVVHAAVASGRPFLGICVGMQMLFDASDEDPTHTGLGVIPGRVVSIPDTVRKPQMQWNELHVRVADPVFVGLPAVPWVYFVHSYAAQPDDSSVVIATCDYGAELTAVVRRENVVATQFHPEKSAADGLAMLGNFVSTCGGRP